MTVGMVPRGNLVHAPGMPGMATDHAPERQPATPEEAVGLEGLGPIGRAAGIKPAGGGQQRRKEPPVALDQQIWQTPHRIPAGAPPWRHSWKHCFRLGVIAPVDEAWARIDGTRRYQSEKGHQISDRAGGPVLPGLHGNQPPECSGGRPGRPTVPLPRGDLRFHFRDPAPASLGCP